MISLISELLWQGLAGNRRLYEKFCIFDKWLKIIQVSDLMSRPVLLSCKDSRGVMGVCLVSLPVFYFHCRLFCVQ